MNIQLFNSLTTWKDFESALRLLNKKEKGDAFERLTKYYFQLDPVHSSLYDDVWLFNEVPSKHLEKLGLPAQDLGIDIIARVGGEYHAIQCKYHSDKNDNVTFKEVATFLSLFESNKNITKGYICSSADLTSKNLDKVRSEHITLVLSDTWNNLSSHFFESIKAELNKKKVQLVPYQPKAHQKKAIKEAKEYFIKEKHNRGKLIFPCGAGKSLTGFWMTQELGAKSIIVAVPSLSLVKQTLDVYLREIVAHGQKVKWLCICSDEGIGKGDDIAIRTENIGVPCVTEPNYIENWLKEYKNESKIIFTTYQSGRIIADVSKKLNYAFDLGIFDEAHKTVGSDKKLFSHLLFDDNIEIGKRIFMTATERFYVGSKDDIISMDNEEIYGETFSQMSFKEAIETELLTDYKVITIDVKRSEIAEFIQENKLVELNGKWQKETEARSLASMLALRKAMKLFPIRNAVSFHSSIEKAVRNKDIQHFITDFLQYEEIDTFTVSGQMPTTKRNEVVREFANSSKALITNARCLTEGVDIPNIDCIVFADPRKSKVDIVQALGRALRKKDGKDWGYVILPVIYDDTTHEIDNENFNEILAIVRGLASNDERIVEYFRDKNNDKPSKRNEKTDQFQFEVVSEYIDAEKLSSELQIKLWEKLSRFNWMPFEEAREYVRGLGLKSSTEFTEFWRKGKLPKNIPSKPRFVYGSEGFISMPDFLGYKSHLQKWLPYEEAKRLIRQFNFKSNNEFKIAWKNGILPDNFPGNPRGVYKDSGFESMPDFLGYDSLFQDWKNWDNTVKIVHTLGLKSAQEFRRFISKHPIKEIHSSPESYFKDIWKEKGGWSGYLGKEISPQEKAKHRLPFNEAKEFVWSLKLRTGDEWKEYTKSTNFPIFLPSAPQITYPEWKSIEDWIGPTYLQRNDRKKLKYLAFEEARLIVRNQRFNSWEEYQNWKERPNNIPLKPNSIYTEFLGRRDWLGLDPYFAEEKGYLDYESASKLLKEHGIKSNSQFRAFKKSSLFPTNFPLNPEKYYKNIWTDKGGWGGFLGTGYVANNLRVYCSFTEAKKLVEKLNIKSKNHWFEFVQKKEFPSNIPSSPSNVYKSEWKGWADFLGKENDTLL
jgi:superfamily II DNA or RNA helicase